MYLQSFPQFNEENECKEDFLFRFELFCSEVCVSENRKKLIFPNSLKSSNGIRWILSNKILFSNINVSWDQVASEFLLTMPSKHELDNLSMFDVVYRTQRERECDFDYVRFMEYVLIKFWSFIPESERVELVCRNIRSEISNFIKWREKPCCFKKLNVYISEFHYLEGSGSFPDDLDCDCNNEVSQPASSSFDSEEVKTVIATKCDSDSLKLEYSDDTDLSPARTSSSRYENTLTMEDDNENVPKVTDEVPILTEKILKMTTESRNMTMNLPIVTKKSSKMPMIDPKVINKFCFQAMKVAKNSTKGIKNLPEVRKEIPKVSKGRKVIKYVSNDVRQEEIIVETIKKLIWAFTVWSRSVKIVIKGLKMILGIIILLEGKFSELISRMKWKNILKELKIWFKTRILEVNQCQFLWRSETLLVKNCENNDVYCRFGCDKLIFWKCWRVLSLVTEILIVRGHLTLDTG